MSKKTINIYEIDKVIEINHRGKIVNLDAGYYNVGDIYTILNIKGKKINLKIVGKSKTMNVDGKDAIKYKIKCCKKYRNKLIRHLASDFSSAFIITTPNKKGDLIIDFSLETDTYFHILDNLKIVK